MFLGSDTEALVGLAGTVDAWRARAEDLMARMDAAVRALAWQGPAADSFRESWARLHADAGQVCRDVGIRGRSLLLQAQEQDRTSAVDGVVAGTFRSMRTEGGGAPGSGLVGAAAAISARIANTPSDESESDQGMYIWTPFGAINDGGWMLGTDRADVRDDIPIDDPAEFGLTSMNQEGTSNCVTIAFLGGLSEVDPQYFMDRMELVSPGVYDVTLYEDGEPVVVRVEGTVRLDGARGPDGQQNWMTIYEQALIEQGVLDQNGGYSGAGYSASGVVAAVTGVPPRAEWENAVFTSETVPGYEYDYDFSDVTQSVEDLSFHQISELQEQGYTLVLGTTSTSAVHDGNDLVEDHAYVVTGADGETLSTANPWGPSAGYSDDDGPRTPAFSNGQYNEDIDAVYIAPPRDEWAEDL